MENKIERMHKIADTHNASIYIGPVKCEDGGFTDKIRTGYYCKKHDAWYLHGGFKPSIKEAILSGIQHSNYAISSLMQGRNAKYNITDDDTYTVAGDNMQRMRTHQKLNEQLIQLLLEKF